MLDADFPPLLLYPHSPCAELYLPASLLSKQAGGAKHDDIFCLASSRPMRVL